MSNTTSDRLVQELFSRFWRRIWNNGTLTQVGWRDIRKLGSATAYLDNDGAVKGIRAVGLRVQQDYHNNITFSEGDVEHLRRMSAVIASLYNV